jgi:hypothetical protein
MCRFCARENGISFVFPMEHWKSIRNLFRRAWQSPDVMQRVGHAWRWNMARCSERGASHRKKGGHVTPKLGTAERQTALRCLRRLTFAASTKFVSLGDCDIER